MRNPPYTTSDEKMSAVDSTASATSAYAWPMIPAINLMIARIRFTAIPTCAARIARLVGDLTRRNLRCRLAHGWSRWRSHAGLRPRRMPGCVLALALGATPERMHELLAPFVQDLVERRDYDQREQCRCYDATDDCASQRCAEVGSLTEAERYGNHAGDERERRHENRTQAYPAGFDERLAQRDLLRFTRPLGEVHQQDRILRDDSHQQDHTDHRHDVERAARYEQRQHDSDQRQRKRQHDRERIQERSELHHENEVHEQNRET